ncbi:MAG: hypothetical protein WCD35_04365 [Mycobacteriales bacterium]
MTDLHEVHLRQLPVRLWVQAQEQVDALLREFALVATGSEGQRHEVPHRLLALLDDLDRFEGVSSAQGELLRDAAERGLLVLDDLVYHVPAEVAQASQELEALLAEADAYCADGAHLLTLAATSEVVRFRRWFLAQLVDQVAGRPAVTWPDWS